ncbi:MAG: hypothetical protein ACD_62C00150G0005 [uncultured bacterium]|nr:MAG: hypothetical protein ACD_62C00150G0005 [uncultured bacterium]
MSTKRVVFVSGSRLAQNLFEMIIRGIPRKIEFTAYDNLDAVAQAYFPNKVNLIILDQNCLSGDAGANLLTKAFVRGAFKTSKRMFVYSRNKVFDHEDLKQNGFKYQYAKPFLPEELIVMLSEHLGITV